MSVMCVQFAGYHTRQQYVEVSKGFSIPVGNYIIMSCDYDVDCDGKPDQIYAYGEKKNPGSRYAERINLAVVYAKNGFVKKTNVSHIKGYVCGVEVHDFTGNKNKDILLKTFTDENESVMSVFVADFGYEIPKNIMADSRGISPVFAFADGFVVNCSLLNGQNFAVNIVNKKQILIENGIYNQEGGLISNEKVYANPFSDVKATDSDDDMQCELEGVQKVVAGKNETELFKIYSTQKFSENRWDLIKIEVKY